MNTPESWVAAARPNPFYLGCHYFLSSLSKAVFSTRVLHAERVPAVGPAILACNHLSFGDPPLIGSCLRRPVTFLARESLFATPGFSHLIRSLNAVPVDRDGGGASGLRTVMGRLQAGSAVLLFPEGTRSPDGNLQPFRSGIGLMAIRCEAPVIPIRIFGMYEAWGRHLKFPRPHPVTVKFGQPLTFRRLREEAVVADKRRLKAIYEEASQEILQAVTQLQPCEDVSRFP